jgi:hypothetical protein
VLRPERRANLLPQTVLTTQKNRPEGLRYSALKTDDGSTRAARRAGNQQLPAATKPISNNATPYAGASSALTP